jgi:hypothetical protein
MRNYFVTLEIILLKENLRCVILVPFFKNKKGKSDGPFKGITVRVIQRET